MAELQLGTIDNVSPCLIFFRSGFEFESRGTHKKKQVYGFDIVFSYMFLIELAMPWPKSNIFRRTFPFRNSPSLRRWRQEDVAGHLPGGSPVTGVGTKEFVGDLRSSPRQMTGQDDAEAAVYHSHMRTMVLVYLPT